ncbi:MAG: hypothetical protein RLZZ174_716 [Pseudomonadota bacterium]
MSDVLKAPLAPKKTPTSAPFWDGLAEGRVLLQQCEACNQWVFYPRPRCSHCLAPALLWKPVSGAATLTSWTHCPRPTAPPFEALAPQTLAVVTLQEGVRMSTFLLETADRPLTLGMGLAPRFVPTEDDSAVLLAFAPA